jgi:hypothetical protein
MSTFTEKSSFQESNPNSFIEFLQKSINDGWGIVNIQIIPSDDFNTYIADIERINMG